MVFMPLIPVDFSDEDLLAELDSDSSPEDAAEVQKILEERRAAASTATASTSSPPSFAEGSNGTRGFIPRKLRKQQLPLEALPKVAIVGRPNVGKSAMFNRIAGSSIAVVYDYPGVTRDRLYTRAFFGDKEFVLIDTGKSSSSNLYMLYRIFAKCYMLLQPCQAAHQA